jgi:hypothetical protein
VGHRLSWPMHVTLEIFRVNVKQSSGVEAFEVRVIEGTFYPTNWCPRGLEMLRGQKRITETWIRRPWEMEPGIVCVRVAIVDVREGTSWIRGRVACTAEAIACTMYTVY